MSSLKRNETPNMRCSATSACEARLLSLTIRGGCESDELPMTSIMILLVHRLIFIGRGLLRALAPSLMLAMPLAGVGARAEPTTSQTFTLQPGWNAVSFAVLPANTDLNVVFNGIDVESVWAFDSGLGTPDFIQEVSEPALAKAGWRSWVSSARPDAFQNDLFRLQVNRAYLLKLNGAASVPFTISGRPSLRPLAWQPDAFNFRSLPVDPAAPPTLNTFFQPSTAHYSPSAGLAAIYRLTAVGAWQRVAPTDLAGAGVAYWIYCRGGSDYVGPLRLTVDFGDGLDFGVAATELGLNLLNQGSGLNVTVRDLSAPAANPLSRAVRLADATLTWPALVSPLVRSLPSGTSATERLAVRRSAMTSDRYETVLEVADDAGTRYLVPVTASRPSAPAAASLAGSGSAARSDPRRLQGLKLAAVPEAVTHAGLWVGTANIRAISEAHSGPLTTNVALGFTVQLETNVVSKIVTTNRIPNGVTRTGVSMTPTPTGSEFPLRLLLHVDRTGRTRLLKEVIQMWKNGTTTNDANGFAVVDQPGKEVLVTDDTRIGDFVGLTARDGVPVGRRLSTAAFDFPDNELPLAGDFAIGSILRGTNAVSDTFARNPFKHRYHPDHAKGYDLRRVIEFELSAPPANPPPGYGERVLEGLYRETVTGLHRTNIVVGGTFRLSRVTTTAELNPQP